MAELEILEGNGYRLHLKILFENEVIVITHFEQPAIDRLSETIEDPVPAAEAGEHPLEIVVDEDGSKRVEIEVAVGETDRPLRVSSPVETEKDLFELYETIKSPQPLRVRRKPFH